MGNVDLDFMKFFINAFKFYYPDMLGKYMYVCMYMFHF